MCIQSAKTRGRSGFMSRSMSWNTSHISTSTASLSMPNGILQALLLEAKLRNQDFEEHFDRLALLKLCQSSDRMWYCIEYHIMHLNFFCNLRFPLSTSCYAWASIWNTAAACMQARMTHWAKLRKGCWVSMMSWSSSLPCLPAALWTLVDVQLYFVLHGTLACTSAFILWANSSYSQRLIWQTAQARRKPS